MHLVILAQIWNNPGTQSSKPLPPLCPSVCAVVSASSDCSEQRAQLCEGKALTQAPHSQAACGIWSRGATLGRTAAVWMRPGLPLCLLVPAPLHSLSQSLCFRLLARDALLMGHSVKMLFPEANVGMFCSPVVGYLSLFVSILSSVSPLSLSFLFPLFAHSSCPPLLCRSQLPCPLPRLLLYCCIQALPSDREGWVSVCVCVFVKHVQLH